MSLIQITSLAADGAGRSNLYVMDLWHPQFRRLIENGVIDAALNDKERVAISRFRQPENREARRATRWLLRTALALVLRRPPATVRLDRKASGEATLAASAGHIWFSMSRAPGIVAVAISQHGRIGVDVETPDRLRNALFEDQSWLTEKEIADDDYEPETRRLSRLMARWTLKEAYTKAKGVGFALAPQDVGFDLHSTTLRLLANPQIEPRPDQWSFRLLDGVNGSTIALATGPSDT